ncbi:MAG TPA: hypothetical protein VI387_06070 [Candidatus Brocadiales bacterium]|nr:hypothetical protein [Candidatus Brocadiales bacterium]
MPENITQQQPAKLMELLSKATSTHALPEALRLRRHYFSCCPVYYLLSTWHKVVDVFGNDMNNVLRVRIK